MGTEGTLSKEVTLFFTIKCLGFIKGSYLSRRVLRIAKWSQCFFTAVNQQNILFVNWCFLCSGTDTFLLVFSPSLCLPFIFVSLQWSAVQLQPWRIIPNYFLLSDSNFLPSPPYISSHPWHVLYFLCVLPLHFLCTVCVSINLCWA